MSGAQPIPFPQGDGHEALRSESFEKPLKFGDLMPPEMREKLRLEQQQRQQKAERFKKKIIYVQDEDYSPWDRFREIKGIEADNLSDRFKGFNDAQNKFNEARKRSNPESQSCTGLNINGRWDEKAEKNEEESTAPHRCRQLLCPACWHRSQADMVRRIRAETVRYPYLYIRRTDDIEYDDEIHPAVEKRFRADGTRYRQIAWNYTCESNEDRIDSSGVPIKTCRYSLVGVFGSEKPIQFTSNEAGGAPVVVGGFLVGAVFTEPYQDVYALLDEWCKVNQHPVKLVDHDNYDLYVSSIEATLKGRKRQFSVRAADEVSDAQDESV